MDEGVVTPESREVREHARVVQPPDRLPELVGAYVTALDVSRMTMGVVAVGHAADTPVVGRAAAARCDDDGETYGFADDAEGFNEPAVGARVATAAFAREFARGEVVFWHGVPFWWLIEGFELSGYFYATGAQRGFFCEDFVDAVAFTF